MLQRIQNELERIYEISCDHLVEEYLLPENSPEAILPEHPWIHHSDEALLVEQNSENLDVGLWFNPDLLEWSSSKNWENLSLENDPENVIRKMGPLVEGVSHFVYLLWKAEQNRPVTQLEMELQAEVDKYILFSSILNEENSIKIMQTLFEKVEWIPFLDNSEKERYETALKYASQYCDYLRQNRLKKSSEKFLPEIRSFYRMDQSEKIRHIQI